jgi:hypothetical protein
MRIDGINIQPRLNEFKVRLNSVIGHNIFFSTMLTFARQKNTFRKKICLRSIIHPIILYLSTAINAHNV